MSMLIRTGTIIRKPTRKSSVRRTKSAGSAVPGSHTRALDKGDQHNTTYSVPTSPVAKLHQQLYTEQSLNNSPAKASVTTTTSTIVSYDDSRLAYKTCIDRTVSCDTGTGNQDTVVQIQEASNDAENVCDFLCTASQIVCSSTFITSAVGLSMIIPVVMIVFGVKYLDECPIQPRIPIFHMVGGCFGVLKVAVTLYRSVQRRHQGSSDNIYDTVGREGGIHHRTYRTLDIILSVFLLSWHILGTVWVFRIWKPLFQPLLHRPDMWCERSLYLFSIAIIVGVDTIIVLALLGMACLACFYRTNIITSGGAVDR